MIVGLFLLAACSPGRKPDTESDREASDSTTIQPDMDAPLKAMAQLSEANSSGVMGSVTFTAVDEKTVKMEIEVKNITPGKHALHLHAKGDCSAPDATSAGGHWNPTEMPHGKRGEGEFHKGDIINLDVAADSTVSWSKNVEGWTIGGDSTTNILGHAVIIHAGEDDFTSQPSGAAGSRIACGVIMPE